MDVDIGPKEVEAWQVVYSSELEALNNTTDKEKARALFCHYAVHWLYLLGDSYTARTHKNVLILVLWAEECVKPFKINHLWRDLDLKFPMDEGTTLKAALQSELAGLE